MYMEIGKFVWLNKRYFIPYSNLEKCEGILEKNNQSSFYANKMFTKDIDVILEIDDLIRDQLEDTLKTNIYEIRWKYNVGKWFN